MIWWYPARRATTLGAGASQRPPGRRGSAALFVGDRGVALAREALAVAVGGAEALALGVELVVGEAALVQARAGLVQLGLGALAVGLLLGVLGTGGSILGSLAVGAGDLVALADELTLARLR